MPWTETDMPELAGYTAVITGANSGLGFHAARALAEANAHVVLTVRSLAKGQEAVLKIRETHPAAALTIELLDLADLKSVRDFAKRTRESIPKIHMLINNAGIMGIPRDTTREGYEKQFGVNHLGHFALTGLLLDRLERAGVEEGFARVVNVTSNMYARGEMKFDDLMMGQSYDRWKAYAQSKLANLLFSHELDKRLRARGMPVAAVAAHPGYADTNLQIRGPEQEGSAVKKGVMKLMNSLLAQSAAKGTLPLLYAAAHGEVEGGELIAPDGFMALRGYPEKHEPKPKARDDEDARRLWEESERLTGVDFLPA
jgi:NAD(P)-dependent dehydrogenase (short-subunit alcohol dehydrogenase family)